MLYVERRGLIENFAWGYEQFHEPPDKNANHHTRFQTCHMLVYKTKY